MKKLDKFLLKSFVWPFIAILFIVIFILMMQFLWLYIDELVGKGLSFKIIAEFMMWGGCTLLPLSLPLATLLASMMTLGSLGENYELLAIKAAGISLRRVLLPLGLACAVISVAAFFIANNLIPVAYNKIYTLRDDIGKTKEEIKIPTETFYDGIEGYILRVNSRDEKTQMMHGVMVYDHTGNKGNTSITLADSAMIKMSEDKSYLTFILYDGCNYEETNTKKYRDTTLQLQTIEFARQDLIIPLENYAFHKSDSARYSDQVKSMGLKELRHGKDSIGAERKDTWQSNVRSIEGSSSELQYWSQLDTNGRKRCHSNLSDHISDIGKWSSLDDEIAAYEKAAVSAGNLKETLSMYGRDTMYHNRVLRNIDIEIFGKFALSLACLIFFFIGAPLGSLIRKGGLGASAIISILFFVAYWVIDISGKKLARDGAISPWIGVFISSFVLGPTGLYLTWKAVNDSSFINMDSVKSGLRKIRTFIVNIFKKDRIVFMGTPEFAVESLDRLIQRGYKVVGAVTVADKPSGRGLKVNESAVKKYAVAHGIPVLQPVSLKDEGFINALKAWKPDLFVVVAFRMLPEVVWSIPRRGTFNLHAALLPQYRGAAPINWAIINGEKMTGVTTFMIDHGIDTGKIMYREQCRIEDTDTAGSLHDKLMGIGAELVVNTTEAIIEGSVEFRVQRSFIQGSETLHPAPKITKEMCRIDWSETTESVYNFIRGLSPYPAAYTEICREGESPLMMKIYFGERMELNGVQPAPGTLLSDGKTFLAVATKDGAISLTDIQLSGKKRMDVKTFLLGFRDIDKWFVVEEALAKDTNATESTTEEADTENSTAKETNTKGPKTASLRKRSVIANDVNAEGSVTEDVNTEDIIDDITGY